MQRIGIDREAVIVRGDFDLAGELVQHRMIRAAMAELQLVGLAAEREAEDLMAEADAEDRRLADQLADVVDLRVRAARDRPGRSRETRRRASARARLRRGVSAGTTVTRQPTCTRRRRMFRLMPKS